MVASRKRPAEAVVSVVRSMRLYPIADFTIPPFVWISMGLYTRMVHGALTPMRSSLSASTNITDGPAANFVATAPNRIAMSAQSLVVAAAISAP